MNDERTITNHQQLILEKERLQRLIANQQNIIRHDFDELKNEFKKELKPAIDAANFVKRLAKPQYRKETLLTAGAGILIDITLRKLFRGSNVLVQLLLPKIIKNYASTAINVMTTRKG